MKEVTRAVRPEDLAELLEHPPRATLAFVRDGVIQAAPAAFRLVDGRRLFGVPRATGPLPPKAKLLIDDGPWHFDLRGVWMRGLVAPTDLPPGAGGDLDWYELSPDKSVAWHYGRMRLQ
jgi:hypothetical protein